MNHRILEGDCLDLMRELPDCSVDSIVTDPPYGLGFMGKGWDHSVPGVDYWREALRVLKPGGHLLAFGGTRTYHRMACAVEDAGFEIRDSIMWVYGSGFPKSLDVSKAIDKAAGARGHDSTRFNAVGQQGERTTGGDKFRSDHPDYVKPRGVTADAQQWEGWGTALKPAHEPIIMARKPLIGTVAANVLAHGTGALNIDGCRVAGESTRRHNSAEMGYHGGNLASEYQTGSDSGRWPANLIHDGSDAVVAEFPANAGAASPVRGTEASHTGAPCTNCYGEYGRVPGTFHADSGSAARFFYCAKASKSDRNEGLEAAIDRALARAANNHPTVKPAALMRYLCRLVTPPGGTVLDPFAGSGSTGKAAALEGFGFIGMELDADYATIARARIAAAAGTPPLPQEEAA